MTIQNWKLARQSFNTMRNNVPACPESDSFTHVHANVGDYVRAECQFIDLLKMPDLDAQFRARTALVRDFEQALDDALH
ncbi:MAG TPA: hypothetical protein VHK27_07660, partial [Gammaproteobacteria bacterium]|nr:hypothetical protein [Gammaproteobacteria bacterium]